MIPQNRIIIEPNKSSASYWWDIWHYRGLLYYLTWKDIIVRYKQTVVGLAWCLIRPAFAIITFTFLGWLFDIPDNGVPRALLVSAATLPWQFFANAFSDTSNSMVGNASLISKIYFPKLILPISSIIVCFIDFLISFAIVIALMFWYGITPGIEVLFLPFFLLLSTITATGFGLLVGALNVRYRDFRYLVPIIIQLGYYASPLMYDSSIIYNSTKLPQFVKVIYALNPMVGVIDGFRWCLLGSELSINTVSFICSIGVSLLFLLIGIKYFRKVEKQFVDYI